MTFNATALAVILLTLGAFTVYIVRGMIQSARTPKGMATRVTRSKWEDAKPHDSRDWQRAFARIVSGK